MGLAVNKCSGFDDAITRATAIANKCGLREEMPECTMRRRAAVAATIICELQSPPRPWADTRAFVEHLRTCERCCKNLAARVHTKLTATLSGDRRRPWQSV